MVRSAIYSRFLRYEQSQWTPEQWSEFYSGVVPKTRMLCVTRLYMKFLKLFSKRR